MKTTHGEFRFRLYWLRESACDAGTLIPAAELEPAIRDRVMDLARQPPHSGGRAEWLLRLPFMDRREWRRRDAILRSTPLERTGNLIRAVLEPAAATRDAAATCVLTDPAWQDLPAPATAEYFPLWQRVSVRLQREMKRRIAGAYFADAARLENRAAGYAVAVYQASRPFFGRPRTEFTYDLGDYPVCQTTLDSALRLTGRATQAVLADIQARLRREGRPELARRYAPAWYEDVLVAARKKPKLLVELLAAESKLVNAVIAVGAEATVAMVNRSSRAVNSALRNLLGVDMRRLGCAAFEEATRVLAETSAERGNHLGGRGAVEDPHVGTAGRPYA
jgi:hypothetical protein